MKSVVSIAVIIIGTTLMVISSVIITAIVYYSKTNTRANLTWTFKDDPPKKQRNIPKLTKSQIDWTELAMKYGVSALAEIPTIMNIPYLVKKLPEVEPLNFTEMASSLDLPCEEYDFQTQDGYILKIFHVEGSQDDIPVLLVHGFLDSADTFVLRGSGSLVEALFEDGRDVWIANFRGSKYSRRHVSLDPDKDKSFWQFSFHEFGVLDLPAIIDFVLAETGESQLQAISHSLGSTAFFVMGSSLPEYNNKIDLHVSMAPLCHLEHLQPPLSNILLAETFVNILLRSMGKEEIFGSYSQLLPFVKSMCSFGYLGSELCLEGVLFYIFGKDDSEVKLDFVPLVLAHFPAGTSLNNMNHISQLYLRQSFSRYDHGFIGNFLKYFAFKPPAYDLSKISMRTWLFAARNDKASTWKDVERLRRELPNVVGHSVVNREAFNHIDYVWGENVHKYLYPQIIEVLQI